MASHQIYIAGDGGGPYSCGRCGYFHPARPSASFYCPNCLIPTVRLYPNPNPRILRRLRSDNYCTCQNCSHYFHVATTSSSAARISFDCPNCLYPYHNIHRRSRRQSQNQNHNIHRRSRRQSQNQNRATQSQDSVNSPNSSNKVAVFSPNSTPSLPSCPICMDDFKIGDAKETINELPCRHCFHKDCISKWLRRSKTCPMCRYKFKKDDVVSIIRQPILQTAVVERRSSANSVMRDEDGDTIMVDA